MLRTQCRDAFANYSGSFVSIDVLLTWASTRFSSVAVKHVERPYGVSNYTLRKLIIHALNMMTGFSVLPLQLASLMGFAMTALGGLILVYVLVVFAIYGRAVPGFAFLASIISIFSGAQMFAVQMIGATLWIVYGFLIGAIPVIAANVLVFTAAAWTLVRGKTTQLASRIEQA